MCARAAAASGLSCVFGFGRRSTVVGRPGLLQKNVGTPRRGSAWIFVPGFARLPALAAREAATASAGTLLLVAPNASNSGRAAANTDVVTNSSSRERMNKFLRILIDGRVSVRAPSFWIVGRRRLNCYSENGA